MTEPQRRVFYRIVRRDPPDDADFLSYEALGRSPPDHNPETVRRWRGVSAFDSLRAARTMARRRPRLGAWVAELHIEEISEIRWERTGKTAGHYTLWGRARELLALVVAVWPVVAACGV